MIVIQEKRRRSNSRSLRTRPNMVRARVYISLNIGFMALVTMAALTGGNPNARILYLCALSMICSTPILFADSLNGRYSILIIFLALLFLFYGIPDVVGLFDVLGVSGTFQSDGMLSLPEVAVLIGVGMLIVGYLAATTIWRRSSTGICVADWKRHVVILLGLSLWTIGIAATWVWQLEVVDRNVQLSLGPFEAIGLVLSRMLQPVGIGMLAYSYIMSRSRWLLIVILAILGIEFMVGFVADSKELAMRGAAILVAGHYLLNGRVPTRWIATAGIVIALSFAVFQAYRFEILQTGAQTRAVAAEDLSENLDTTLASELLADGYFSSGLRGFVERVRLKPTMELVMAHVGKDVQYQKGYTIALTFAAFIPRLIWPSKPDSSVGRLFNREFEVSADPDTYISATHLGELYWNFGWAGIVVGMFLIGFLLGYVNSRLALSECKSVTRFLILVTTIYFACLRFEGSIAIQYTVWVRSVAIILLLHFIFSRIVRSPSNGSPTQADSRLSSASGNSSRQRQPANLLAFDVTLAGRAIGQ